MATAAKGTRKRAERIHSLGATDKSAAAGAQVRATGQVIAGVVGDATEPVLRGFGHGSVADGATVFTDNQAGNRGLPCHKTVCSIVAELVNGQAHMNGTESVSAGLKLEYNGTFHHVGAERLHC